MTKIRELYTRCWNYHGVRVEHQYSPEVSAKDNTDKFWVQGLPSPCSIYEMVALARLLDEVKESVGDEAWEAAKAEIEED